MSRSFLRALAVGVGVAAAIGFALLLTLVLVDATNEGDFLSLFLLFSVLQAAFVGAAFTGTLVGLATGRHAPSRLSASGAGALAGLLGQALVLLFVFVGAALIASADTTTTDGPLFQETEADTLGWSDFGPAMLYLIPAGFAGALVAPLAFTAGSGLETMPWKTPDDAATGTAHDADPFTDPSAASADFAPAADPPAGTRRLRCPECATINLVSPGDPIRCSGCGLTGRSPA